MPTSETLPDNKKGDLYFENILIWTFRRSDGLFCLKKGELLYTNPPPLQLLPGISHQVCLKILILTSFHSPALEGLMSAYERTGVSLYSTEFVR